MIHSSRIFGVSTWGEILLFQTSSLFFSIILMFGTEIYGLREISKYISNRNEIFKIINQIFHLRIINYLTFSLISFLTFFFYKLNLSSFLIINFWTLSLIISPLWIYTALGRLNHFFFIEVITKLLTFVIIYFNVMQEKDNYLIIIILISSNYLLNTASLIKIRRYIFIYRLKTTEIKKIYQKTIPFFIIQFCANVFTSFPILIVGFTLGSTQAAIFGNGERIFRIFRSLYSPINRVVLKFSSSNNFTNKNLKKGFLVAGLGGILLFIIGVIFVIFFIEIALGEKYIGSKGISLILMLSLPFVYISNQILHSYIYPMNNELFFMKTLLWLTPVNIIMLLSLAPMFQTYGTAISMVIAELLLFVSFFKFIKSKL